MLKKDFVDNILTEMLNNGSSKEELEKLRNDAVKLLEQSKDKNIEEILEPLITKYYESSMVFLHAKSKEQIPMTTALSSSIYIPNKNGEYKMEVIGGLESRYNNSPLITKETVFDVASITKLLTVILVFKMIDYGFFNLNNKIADLDNDFKGLEDFTIHDLLLLHGELHTDLIIKDVKTTEEALNILKSTYLYSKDRTTNFYSCIGAIILSKIIEKVYYQKKGEKFGFDEILYKYICFPYDLHSTKFNPYHYFDSISGNGNLNGVVHDPKSRILGGNVGSAGIFTNSHDLCLLAKNLFNVQNKHYDINKDIVSYDTLAKLGTITFPHSKQSHKGYLGIFQKHSSGLDLTYVSNIYANYSFSYEGWTGSVAVFDPKNKLHNNVLVNAIGKAVDENNLDLYKNNKPIGYHSYLNFYQREVDNITVLMSIVKRYYDLYEEKNNFNKTLYLKLQP